MLQIYYCGLGHFTDPAFCSTSHSCMRQLTAQITCPTDAEQGGRKSPVDKHVVTPQNYIPHLRQQFPNSEFGVFYFLVQKETFADALLTGKVS